MLWTLTDRLVFLGDSITERGWYMPLIRSLFGGADKGIEHVFQRPKTFNMAHGGDKTADLVGVISTRVTAFAPTKIVLHIGVNDSSGGVPTVTFQANYDSILSQILAANPNVEILCVNILARGENWPNGANGGDVDVTDKNTAIATVCANRGVKLYDIRADFLAWEAANNPGHAVSGLLTEDGVHPRRDNTEVGESWMSSRVASVITRG